MDFNLLKLGFNAVDLYDKGVVDRENVNIIKKWLADLNIPCLSDEQIILFLMSCDQHIENTQHTIETYYDIRKKNPDLFNNRRIDTNEIQNALKTGNFCTWCKHEGDFVFVYYKFKSKVWDWNLHASAKLLFMAIDCAIHDYPPKGLFIFVDTEDMCLTHLGKFLHPHLLQTIFDYLQKALPVKLYQIHFVKTVSFIDRFMKIILPFMDKKLFEKIIFHKQDLQWEIFHENYIQKTSLPKEFGGDLVSLEDLQENMLKKIADLKLYYEFEELWREKCE